jgi:acetate kinase
MADAVLTINAGSSSLKFSVYEVAAGDRLSQSADGQIEGIGTAPHFRARGAGGEAPVDRRWPAHEAFDHDRSFRELGGWLREFLGDKSLIGVGHRVVHGGVDHTAPVRIDPGVLARLEALCPLAPLHQPHNLAGIRAVAAVQPDLPQVACFDTTPSSLTGSPCPAGSTTRASAATVSTACPTSTSRACCRRSRRRSRRGAS